MIQVTIPNEIWKPINGYENLYEISNLGRVKSKPREWFQKHRSGKLVKYKKTENLLKLQADRKGYIHVDLFKNKIAERKLVHRLVAEHFIDNPNNYKYINHIDSNPSNNNVKNLEWCTQSYNIKFAYDNGKKIPPHKRSVAQINIKTNETVYIYSSISEAHRLTGFNNIGVCCRGLRNKAGGYKWQYV